MKKSTKKKTDKYTRIFSNSTNYRDKDGIFNQFNKSVLEYKRFSDLFNGGDDSIAASKLNDAGTHLYMCCEWALKYFLYNRYIERCSEQEITAQEKERLINYLSDGSNTILTLIADFKRNCKTDPSILGIHMEIISNNAQIVNNDPKHNKTIPNPQKYRESLNEIRKFLKAYIDENAELELIDDSIYGEDKAWYEILDDTSEFNTAYSYVLITKKIGSVNLKGLFSQKWDLVIDMDPDSDISGLAYSYSQITSIKPRIITLDAANSKMKFSYSHMPYWILANGTSDNPESIVDPKKWGTAHGKYLPNILEEFHKEYHNPVKAFVYPIDNEKNLRRIIETFNDVYDSGDDINFCVLSSDSEYNSIEDDNFIISKLSIEDFADNLAKINQNNDFVSRQIKKEIPAENSKRVSLDESFVTELSDSFETVFIDIDREDELDSSKLSRQFFYKGETEISWYGLRENFDVTPQELKKIEDRISQDLKEHARLLKKVDYVPGIGGTTLMRHLAWDFRESYPTFILKRLNEQTGKNLQKIYNLTHVPILIFADNNNISFDEAKALHVDLKRMGFAFVICYFQRKLKGIKDSEEGATYTIVHDFGLREVNQMQLKLQDFIVDEKARSNFISQVNEMDSSDRLPFVMSMYAFDKDFRGIKPYITNFIEKMNAQSQKILFALSLADYGNAIINTQYFLDLFNDESADKFLLEESPGINELVRVENTAGKKTIRIRYHLFGEEILKQMSNGKDATEISFLNLVDNILAFIEDSRRTNYSINQDTLDMLRCLFITRNADTNTERPVFSPLISKLREEHKTTFDGGYDPTTDAIVRIFNKLVEIYPDEPHFAAHLARFYFYIDKNYEKGFEYIDKAIKLYESETGHKDPLLYHMKAMGYSSRITNLYCRQITKELHEDSKFDTSELKEKIREDAQLAFNYFKIVRESNAGVAGHVSEINLCIQIASLARNMLDDQESFSDYITSEDGQWATQYIDRAETLWEECKQLASDSAYEDLDGIEERLRSLTASIRESVDIWKSYIEKSNNQDCSYARRMLARSYMSIADKAGNESSREEYYKKVVQLMEDNIAEDNQHVGNIRIWFDSIKHLNLDNQEQLIQDAIIKLNRWITLTDSADAHYYRFILKFIQTINGSSLAESDLPKLLRELKQKSANKYNRTIPQHWLTKRDAGLNALITNSRNKRDALPEDEMSDMLLPLIGRISNNYVNDSHAYITYRGVEVFFNPSATKGEISKANINQRVSFGIGFSYDGPRAYNSSIKLIGKENKVDDVKRQLECGIAVKCEVTKNVEYYVQVRIIGFSEIGSIHINELVDPYSAEKRPIIGTVFDGKVIGKSYDNVRQCNVWKITMEMDDIKEEQSETAMAQALRKAGIELGQNN